MATPSVIRAVPSVGPTGGGNLVQIYGDGFSVPEIDWTVTGVSSEPSPSVQVLFDDVPAIRVDVARSNLLLVRPPVSPIISVVIRMTQNPALTFSTTGGKRIIRSTGDWIANGFRSGQTIRVSKTASNNRNYHIQDVSASTLTLLTSDAVVDEGPLTGVILESREYGEGFVTLTVRNLDANGLPVPGEEVVVEEGYKFQRVQTGSETDLTRVVRQLVRELRKQVIPNVGLSYHSEFDPETGDLLNITGMASLPGIALTGPNLSENMFYSIHGYFVSETVEGTKYLREAPRTHDLSFDFVCISDSLFELVNLQALLIQWARRNTTLSVYRDPEDLSLGSVEYEMELTGSLPMNLESNESNIRYFSGGIIIRGVDIEDMIGFSDMPIGIINEVENIELGLNQTGESFDVGPSPGSAP